MATLDQMFNAAYAEGRVSADEIPGIRRQALSTRNPEAFLKAYLSKRLPGVYLNASAQPAKPNEPPPMAPRMLIESLLDAALKDGTITDSHYVDDTPNGLRAQAIEKGPQGPAWLRTELDAMKNGPVKLHGSTWSQLSIPTKRTIEGADPELARRMVTSELAGKDFSALTWAQKADLNAINPGLYEQLKVKGGRVPPEALN